MPQHLCLDLFLALLLQGARSTPRPYHPSSVTVAVVQTIWRGITTQFDSSPHSDVESRDCLAAPGNMIDATSNISAGSILNKNKTCYKCQQEGHVRFYISTLSSDYSDSPRLREIAQRIPNLLAELITHSPTCRELSFRTLITSSVITRIEPLNVLIGIISRPFFSLFYHGCG